MIMMHLDQNVPNSSYCFILTYFDLEQRFMWPKWHFGTFLKFFWPKSLMPPSYLQKSVFGVFTNVHNLTPIFDFVHTLMGWESRMWAGPLYLWGGKAPSLLFHLQNNTSLHDMETKLYTHINKTLAMCLEKKFWE